MAYAPIEPTVSESEMTIATIMHEITHILGFSNTLYKYYQNDKLETLGEDKVFVVNPTTGRKSIILPLVVKEGQDHFDCDSITSVDLEDGPSGTDGSGTSNSHWERVVLGDESLTGT